MRTETAGRANVLRVTDLWITLKKPTPAKEDVRTLKAHSKARTPVAKVSKAMKRTVGALRRRAGILGVGLGHRR